MYSNGCCIFHLRHILVETYEGLNTRYLGTQNKMIGDTNIVAMKTLLDLPDVSMVLTIAIHKGTSLSVGTLIHFNWWRSQTTIL